MSVIAPAPAAAAANAPCLVEQVLVDLWRLTLDLETVDLDTSFFSLGGDSLLAMVTIEQIKQRLGWRLNLGELMRVPTIRSLVASRSSVQLANDERPLVRLSNRGELAPLVLVHPECGLASVYGKLVRWLGRGRGCYALQSPLCSGEDLPVTIEEQAELYADLLYEELADEELHLAGWGSGAAVAYEIARRSADKQLNVAKLVLIDPPATGVAPPSADELFAGLARQLSPQGGPAPTGAARGLDERALELLAPMVFGPHAEDGAGRAELAKVVEAYRICANAAAEYAVAAAPAIDALLLHASSAASAVAPWRAACAAGVEQVGAEPCGPLREPQARALAEKISAFCR